MKKLIENFNSVFNTKPKKIAFFAAWLLLGFLFIPHTQEGYTKIEQKICKYGTNCVEYKAMDPIIIDKGADPHARVFDSSKREIGTVNRSDIVFKGTSEYEKALKNKQEYDKLKSEMTAKTQAETQKQLSKIEPEILKVFYKVDVKKDNFVFYINPVVWNALSFDKKENLFKNCGLYGALKTNDPQMDTTKQRVQTHIYSARNKSELASYSIIKGIILK